MELMPELKILVHYFLHFIFPAIIARIFYPDQWLKAFMLMLATMLVDLDHLLANPVFDPGRNSIGYHLLHTWPMIGLYFLGCIFLKGNYRIIAVGLLFHMFTDFQDYYFW